MLLLHEGELPLSSAGTGTVERLLVMRRYSSSLSATGFSRHAASGSELAEVVFAPSSRSQSSMIVSTSNPAAPNAARIRHVVTMNPLIVHPSLKVPVTVVFDEHRRSAATQKPPMV